MNKIVVKIGGSVLRTTDDVLKIVDILHQYECPVIVVVSAFYGVTDALYNLVEDSSSSEKEDRLAQLYKRTVSLIPKNYLSEDVAKHLLNEIKDIFTSLDKLLIQLSNDNAHEIKEIILSYGEKISATVLSVILQNSGLNFRLALPEEIGIITSGAGGSVKVDLTETRQRVRAFVLPSSSYIVPGFYGVSQTGQITLLGRGGSDYSASVLASSLDAKSLDLWKDVLGLRSTDPKLTGNTRAVNQISLREAEELASFGAGIIHPQTIAPLVGKNIPVRIFSIDQPFVNQPLTIIQNQGKSDSTIKSVSAIDTLGIITISGFGIGMNPRIISAVTDTLSNNKIEIQSLMTSRSQITMLLAKDDCGRALSSLETRIAADSGSISIRDDIAVIAMVGESLSEENDIAGIALQSLAACKIRTRFCFVGSAAIASYIVVRRAELGRAVRAIHRGFFPEMPKINKRPRPTRLRMF